MTYLILILCINCLIQELNRYYNIVLNLVNKLCILINYKTCVNKFIQNVDQTLNSIISL